MGAGLVELRDQRTVRERLIHAMVREPGRVFSFAELNEVAGCKAPPHYEVKRLRWDGRVERVGRSRYRWVGAGWRDTYRRCNEAAPKRPGWLRLVP